MHSGIHKRQYILLVIMPNAETLDRTYSNRFHPQLFIQRRKSNHCFLKDLAFKLWQN
jgi:hypothetical protein